MSDAKNYIVDKSKIQIPEGTMEDFIRPEHPDFKDFYELQKARWSGIRKNEISQEVEFWVLGEIKARCKTQQEILTAYQNTFGLYKDQVFRKERKA